MYGEDFVKDIPQKFNHDDRIIRRKSYWIPFGYVKLSKNPNYLVPVPKELAAIDLAIQYRDSGEYSWTELAAWLHKVTGRKISHMGFKNIYKRAKEKENATTSTKKTNTPRECKLKSYSIRGENSSSWGTQKACTTDQS